MRELRPPQWPRPTALHGWRNDYIDIRERILRHGCLDVSEELFTANSDDGWSGFSGRHHSEEWRLNWAQLNQRDQARRNAATQRARQRLSTVASREQERWEAEQLQRQRAKQAEADREWREAELAKATAAIAEQERAIAEARGRYIQEVQRKRTEASPDVMTLLRLPPEQLEDHQKLLIARALETLFALRGAGPLKVAVGREAEVAGLSAKQLGLAKYQWYRDNLKTLGRLYPPAIL